MPPKPSKKVRQPARKIERSSHPVMYEVNARVLLHELSEEHDRHITFGTVPTAVADRWKEWGIDVIWLMGVWTTGPLGRAMALRYPGLEEEYRKALPDFRAEDVIGSPYAVQAYEVPEQYGGHAGLAKFRRMLASRGIALALDYVVNHTARDHQWVSDHPDFYVAGTMDDESRNPDLFFYTHTHKGGRVIAYGRDPYFPGWTDTAQLNVMHEETRAAMIGELERIAGMCDAVRCDMAMLVLNDIFLSTWSKWIPKPVGEGPEEFWRQAIRTVKAKYPDFLFIAEAYWGKEAALQEAGFDFTYDKILYDRLVYEGAPSVREHLSLSPEYQRHSVRFIENHDEPTAATAFQDSGKHFSAAVIAATVPGMVLFHDGQFEGRTVHLPVQLGRRPEEPISHHTRAFYQLLLGCIRHPIFRNGQWRQLQVEPAWSGNWTWQNFLAFWWELPGEGERLIIVNYAPHASQCYIRLPLGESGGKTVEFRDLMGEARYSRERATLLARGMYFDLPDYHFHIFEVVVRR